MLLKEGNMCVHSEVGRQEGAEIGPCNQWGLWGFDLGAPQRRSHSTRDLATIYRLLMGTATNSGLGFVQLRAVCCPLANLLTR